MPLEIQKIIKDKVDGVWIPEHTFDGHFYKHVKKGEVVRSVTTKQIADKPHLVKWAIRVAIEWLEENNRFERLKDETLRKSLIKGAQEAHTEVRDDAGSVGGLAHKVIEGYIRYWVANGVPPEDIRKGFKEGADTRAIASARSVESLFRKKATIIPIACELTVGSLKIKTAGTLDFLCLWNGKLTLVDFKTSNNVSDDYSGQVAAYKYMFEEMTGLKIEDMKILHLSKDDDRFHVYKVPKVAAAYRAYKGIAAYYDWRENGRAKLALDVKVIKLR